MKRAERREQVIRCAAEVFAECGYHQTTVEDIVKRAKIARGTFYLYFQDKRSLFDELVDRFMKQISSRIVRIDPAVPPDECVRLLRENTRAILETTVEHRALGKILVSDAVGLDPEFDQKLLAFYTGVNEMLERSLRRGQKTGLVKPCDVPITSRLIIGAFKELMYQLTVQQLDLDIPRVVDAIIHHYSNGLVALPIND